MPERGIRHTKVFDTIASALVRTVGFSGGAGLGILYEYHANAWPAAAVPSDELDDRFESSAVIAGSVKHIGEGKTCLLIGAQGSEIQRLLVG